MRAFSAEVGNYPVGDCRGIFRPSIRALHPGGIVAVFHVAEFDQNRRILGQIQAREIGAAVKTVRADVSGRFRPAATSESRITCASCTAGPPCAAFSGGLE